jgi:hypothetical protein
MGSSGNVKPATDDTAVANLPRICFDTHTHGTGASEDMQLDMCAICREDFEDGNVSKK